MDTTEVKSETATEEKPAEATSEEQVRAQYYFDLSRENAVSTFHNSDSYKLLKPSEK